MEDTPIITLGPLAEFTGMTDTTSVALEGNRLAWSLAANCDKPEQLGRIMTAFVNDTDEALLLHVFQGALLVLTTLALEPATAHAEKTGVRLRREFAIALHKTQQMQKKHRG
ncbi:hypothetical protein [Kitasatospora herbaricolor]|uniref:hypothetical protein n=1 Tax=Kitasatospora herbaricolor TaxID=68217 RepID=UPI0036D91070